MGDLKTEIVRLNGKNYATWKTQCRMLLLKEGLWDFVTGTEAAQLLMMPMLLGSTPLGRIAL